VNYRVVVEIIEGPQDGMAAHSGEAKVIAMFGLDMYSESGDAQKAQQLAALQLAVEHEFGFKPLGGLV